MFDFLRKLLGIRRRDALADRLREEFDFHSAMAGHEIGRPTRLLEEAHDAWTLGSLEHLWLDCRYAVRGLAKSPAFCLLATIGTTLGIAAITSVLSVADRALVRALPYGHSDRLVVVSDQLLKLGMTRMQTSVANFVDYRAQTRVFEDVAAFQPRALTVSSGERVERVPGMAASSNLLDVLGSSVSRGRWFLPEERHALVAVLADGYWRTRWAGEASVIGRSLRVNGETYQIIGILPPGFAFRVSGEPPAIWIPSPMEPGSRDATQIEVVARLKAGVSPAEAAASMHVLAAALKQQYRAGMGPHGEDGGFDIATVPLREELFGSARPTLYALTGASAILLLLATVNTALLWLGRAAARRREAAVRLALGASRRRVAQQMVVEALLPSAAGGALGLALSAIALSALNAASVQELAALDRVTVDYRVFGLAMLASAIAGVLFGIAPLRALFRGGAEGSALAHSRGEVADRGEGRLRPVLIAAQVALSCALLAPSLLLVRSLAALERVDPGFRTNGLLTAYISLPARVDPDRYAQSLGDALRAWRGVGNATVASGLPLSFSEGGDPFSIEGRAYGTSGTLPQFAHALRVGDGFLPLMRIPIVAGRGLESADFGEHAPHVAVVNETLARAFWRQESPLGKHIVMGAPRPGRPWMTIVGIAADIHTGSLSLPPTPQIYRPLPQSPTRSLALVIAEPAGANDLARVLRMVDADVPAYSVQTMERRVADSVQRPRFRTTLFSAYGLLAFLLAAFGVYSLAMYSAVRRRREFALRSALGAGGAQLFVMMISGTLRPAIVGVAAGLAAGYAIARAMTVLLFRTDPSDARIYAIAALLALGVATSAAAIAARPMLRIAPAEVLRSE